MQGYALISILILLSGCNPPTIVINNNTVATAATPVAQAPNPASLVFLTQAQNIYAGSIIPSIKVQARDSSGNKMNLTGDVSLSIHGDVNSSSHLLGNTVVPFIDGLATFSGLSITKSGQTQLTANYANLVPALGVSFQVFSQSASYMVIDSSTNNQIVAVNAPLINTLKVHVYDIYGNPVQAANMAWINKPIQGTSNYGILLGDLITDTSGLATASYLSPSTTVTLANLADVICTDISDMSKNSGSFFVTSYVSVASNIDILSGNLQTISTLATSAELLEVLVTDQNGNIVPNIPVSWSVIYGYGSLVSSTTITNSQGIATASYKAYSLPSTVTGDAVIAKADFNGRSGSVQFNIIVSASTASIINITSSAQKVATSQCSSAIAFSLLDAQSVIIDASQSTTVSVYTSSPNTGIYSDALCTLTTSSVIVAAHHSSGQFFIKSTQSSSPGSTNSTALVSASIGVSLAQQVELIYSPLLVSYNVSTMDLLGNLTLYVTGGIGPYSWSIAATSPLSSVPALSSSVLLGLSSVYNSNAYGGTTTIQTTDNGTANNQYTNTVISAASLKPSISILQTAYSYTKNLTSSPIVFTNRGGTISGCTVTPALPTGLSIDPISCSISGTVSGAVSVGTGTYLITASNIGGSSAVSVTISIYNIHLTSITYSSSTYYFKSLTSNSTEPPVFNQGGLTPDPLTNCTATPAFPTTIDSNGATVSTMFIDQATCRIYTNDNIWPSVQLPNFNQVYRITGFTADGASASTNVSINTSTITLSVSTNCIGVPYMGTCTISIANEPNASAGLTGYANYSWTVDSGTITGVSGSPSTSVSSSTSIIYTNTCSDYGADTLYVGLINVTDSKGQVTSATVTNLCWPFGADSGITLNSGSYVIKADPSNSGKVTISGSSYSNIGTYTIDSNTGARVCKIDSTSFTVSAGATLTQSGCDWVVIGAKNNIVINGAIDLSNVSYSPVPSLSKPDWNGSLTGTIINPYQGQSQPSSIGTAGVSNISGGGLFAGTDSYASFSSACIDHSFVNPPSGVSMSVSIVTNECDDARTVYGGALGGNGSQGLMASALYMKSYGVFSGTGSIKATGQDGTAGAAGGNGNQATGQWHTGCGFFATCYHAYCIASGGGGGGGGGSGGNGGYIYMDTHKTATFSDSNFNVSFGSGGNGGAFGFGGSISYYDTGHDSKGIVCTEGPGTAGQSGFNGLSGGYFHAPKY